MAEEDQEGDGEQHETVDAPGLEGPLPHEREEEQAELQQHDGHHHIVNSRGVDVLADPRGAVREVYVVLVHQVLEHHVQQPWNNEHHVQQPWNNEHHVQQPWNK